MAEGPAAAGDDLAAEQARCQTRTAPNALESGTEGVRDGGSNTAAPFSERMCALALAGSPDASEPAQRGGSAPVLGSAHTERRRVMPAHFRRDRVLIYSNIRPVARHSEELRPNEQRHEPLALGAVQSPQALCLCRSEAKTRHLQVLALNTQQLVFGERGIGHAESPGGASTGATLVPPRGGRKSPERESDGLCPRRNSGYR